MTIPRFVDRDMLMRNLPGAVGHRTCGKTAATGGDTRAQQDDDIEMDVDADEPRVVLLDDEDDDDSEGEEECSSSEEEEFDDDSDSDVEGAEPVYDGEDDQDAPLYGDDKELDDAGYDAF